MHGFVYGSTLARIESGDLRQTRRPTFHQVAIVGHPEGKYFEEEWCTCTILTLRGQNLEGRISFNDVRGSIPPGYYSRCSMLTFMSVAALYKHGHCLHRYHVQGAA